MASASKKRKCHNTLLDRGGEKGKLFELKRHAMYHKKVTLHITEIKKHNPIIDLEDVYDEIEM